MVVQYVKVANKMVVDLAEWANRMVVGVRDVPKVFVGAVIVVVGKKTTIFA